jgi:hypothetical protein
MTPQKREMVIFFFFFFCWGRRAAAGGLLEAAVTDAAPVPLGPRSSGPKDGVGPEAEAESVPFVM